MKKVVIAISIVVMVLLFGIAGALVLKRDTAGPEIIVDESKVASYHAEIAKKELLQGITAVDDKDGDVTGSLMIESVKSSETEDEVLVTYVAMDDSKNVTKLTWKFALTEEAAESPVEEIAEQEEESEETVEEVTSQEEELETEELAPEAPKFTLKESAVQITVGSELNRLEWVEDITDDKDDRNALYRDIQIDGEVDTNTPGTYELTYYVLDSDGNRSNDAKLTVTVTAQ